MAEERENELGAWRSVKGSDIDTEGRVAFRDAPGGRGTLVEAIISYKPPAGALGRAMATLFAKEPAMQARREMKRFTMLMETGEPAHPAHSREEPRKIREQALYTTRSQTVKSAVGDNGEEA